MKKMRLDTEALVVESFDPGNGLARPGTVHAHQPSYGESCTCVDCGNSGLLYSCDFTQCPSGCEIVACGTYDLCGEMTQQASCPLTCGGCGSAQTCISCPTG